MLVFVMPTSTVPEETPKKGRDLFAELYVAGVLTDAGWHVYFPKRDFGFDFIITKRVADTIIIRLVQVKGKYATKGKRDSDQYGFAGELTQIHLEMVLAIPFFTTARVHSPNHIAYLPRSLIREHSKESGWFTSVPARFVNGLPEPRPHYRRFFDADGIDIMEAVSWRDEQPRP